LLGFDTEKMRPHVPQRRYGQQEAEEIGTPVHEVRDSQDSPGDTDNFGRQTPAPQIAQPHRVVRNWEENPKRKGCHDTATDSFRQGLTAKKKEGSGTCLGWS
jgi:hypothetical protein